MGTSKNLICYLNKLRAALEEMRITLAFCVGPNLRDHAMRVLNASFRISTSKFNVRCLDFGRLRFIAGSLPSEGNS